MGLIGGLRKETFFFSLIGPIFSDRITLLKMKRRALFPREFIARSIGRSCARGGRSINQSPSKWSCARCTRCSPATRAEGSRFIQLLGIKGRGVANNRVSALWKKRKRENNGGREREARISGTEIFRGIEKIFRSNERITSWNKLEQQVEKVEEGRSLCMGRELDRKNCSSPVSLFMHRRTRTHTHARTFIHAYIRTYRSLLRISISTCLYNVLSLCFSIAQAHRGPAVVQVQYSTQKFPISTAQRHLRRLS